MTGFKFRHGWEFIGIICEQHLKDAVRNYGTLKVLTLEVESIPLDTTCHVFGCKNRPAFTIERMV